MTLSTMSTMRSQPQQPDAILERLVKGAQKQAERINKQLAKLFAEKELEIELGAKFVSWEDCLRMYGSCWGRHITDFLAFCKASRKWMLKKGESLTDLNNKPLEELLTRVLNSGPTCYEFEVKKGAWSAKSYAINTEDDDVAVFDPDGVVKCCYFEGESLMCYYFGEDRSSAKEEKDPTLVDAVKKAAALSSKQSLIIDNGIPKAVVKMSGKDFTVLNYYGREASGEVTFVGGYTVPTFCIGGDNMNEKLVEVPASRIMAFAETDGKLNKVSLFDLVNKAGKYGGCAGLDKDASLMTDPNEMVRVRVKSFIVPEMPDGTTNFEQEASHYQTRHKNSPGTLLVECNTMGASFISSTPEPTKINPYKYNPETDTLDSFMLSVSSSGKATDDTGFNKAEKEAQAKANKAVARALGPLGAPEGPNNQMVIQVPLKPKPLPASTSEWRSLSAPPGDGNCCYRSLGAADDMEVGETSIAELSYGDYNGDARKIPDTKPERDESIPITVTYICYFALKAPAGSNSLPGECAVSEADVANIAGQIDSLYKIFGEAKNLMDPEANLAEKVTPEQADAIMTDIAEAAVAKAENGPPIKKRRGAVGVPMVAAMA